MERDLRRVLKIHPVEGWFEVRGTREDPLLTRIAYWAHCTFAHRDSSSGEYDEEVDIVIGVTGSEIPLAAFNYMLRESPAGYIHLNDLDGGMGIPASKLNDFVWE